MTAPDKMMNAAGKLRSRMTKKSPALLSRESTGTQSSGEDLSSREPVQVEPKTYFANERTFIQWISAALLLLTVSSIMMGSGSYNGTSSVIAFSSLVLVLYASYVYFRRVKLLRSGNAYGYLDFVGPAILAAGVGLGVFIVFADAVKGSEFLPFGGEGKDKDDDRRFLLSSRVISSPQVPELQPEMRAMDPIFKLQEDVDGKCTRHSIEGINLLEYQPRDIVLNAHHHQSELLVATPQALVSHPLSDKAGGSSSFLLSELPDTEIQSMTLVGDRLFALSMGPYKTELIEFKNASSGVAEKMMESNRFLIQDSTSTTGSMVFVPSSSVAGGEEEEGKLFIYLDGSLHSYHLPSNSNAHHASSPTESLIRTGGINMKVLNRGLTLVDNHSNNEEEDPITDMEYFEGLTYVLRERQNTIEAWDLNRATMVAELLLPPVAKQDKWVGMAFQRGRSENDDKSFLRKSQMAAADASSVYLHMPLDSFPPQLWSFRLVEHDDDDDDDKDEERTVFSFPECDGAAMN